MYKKIFINFKMNKNSDEIYQYLSQLSTLKNRFQYVIFVNYLNLLIAKKFENDSIKIGAQSGYWIDNGNYTSKVSIKQISDENIKWILLGHCEDIKFNKLSNEDLKLQLSKAIELNFNIVFCFGDENYNNNIDSRIKYLINKLLNIGINTFNYHNIILAYEPIFSIGGNHPVIISEIQYIIGKIKEYFMEHYNINFKIIYGGSVNSSNFDNIYNSEIIDGVLIGSFAWEIKNICEIEKKYE